MKNTFLLIICLLLSGCRAAESKLEPVIEFSKIPSAGEGGPNQVGTIEGRVQGAKPGQQIVLFAKSGTWWVQPFLSQFQTTIQPDSTWKNSTHLGTEYAALLADPQYHPPAKTDALPAIGDGVVAVATVKGTENPAAVSKTIKFSGYEWKVRAASSERGGAVNSYDPANAWTDAEGFLHLRIARVADQWTCAEVSLTRTLGYGSYNLVVRDVSRMEPAAVLSMFTWDDLEAGQNHREMNLELTRWGDPANKNLQYVIQPYYIPANVAQFSAPTGVLTHSIHWEPGKAEFKTTSGAKTGASSKTVAEHLFESGVPVSGGETIHLILYVFGYSKQPLQNETEVVIEKFEYLP